MSLLRTKASGAPVQGEDMLMKGRPDHECGRVRESLGVRPDGLCRWRFYRVGVDEPAYSQCGHRCNVVSHKGWCGLMLAEQATSGKTVKSAPTPARICSPSLRRCSFVSKSGCAHYLTHDALNAIYQRLGRCPRIMGVNGTGVAWLICIVFRTGSDARGRHDRWQGRPQQTPCDQQNIDSYVHITKRAGGIVVSGAKAIVTGGPICMSCW